MAQDQSGNEEKGAEQIPNGELNGNESTCSVNYGNQEDHRTDNNYSGSPRPNKKIFVGALTLETTERRLLLLA